MTSKIVPVADLMEVTIGKKKHNFTMLPNYIINDVTLSADALATIAYLESKTEGWKVRPFDIRNRFNWGRYTWLNVSRELKNKGILTELTTSKGTTLSFELNWESNTYKKPGVENQHSGTEPGVDFPTSGNQTPYTIPNKLNTSEVAVEIYAKTTELQLDINQINRFLDSYTPEVVLKSIKLLAKKEGIINPHAWLQGCLSGAWYENDLSEASEAISPILVSKYPCKEKLKADALAALQEEGVFDPFLGDGSSLSFDCIAAFQDKLDRKMNELEH